MNDHFHLLRGVSVGALAFSLAAGSARAQEALPSIDIAGDQNGRPGTRLRARAPRRRSAAPFPTIFPPWWRASRAPTSIARSMS